MIEVDGTPISNMVRRDFRITQLDSNWMKLGHGYLLVWVGEIKDKDNWTKRVMPAWEIHLAPGACKVNHLRPPEAAHEERTKLPLAVCEFPSLQAALNARSGKEYVKDVLEVFGKWL